VVHEQRASAPANAATHETVRLVFAKPGKPAHGRRHRFTGHSRVQSVAACPAVRPSERGDFIAPILAQTRANVRFPQAVLVAEYRSPSALL
jgi:hypothetical protein